MRIGVIGTGRMGRVFARALSAQRGVRVGVAGSGPGRADLLADEVGATAYDRAADLVGDSDAVVIAAATPAHPVLIRLGIAAGIPLFCEKPIALELEETDALIAEAAEAGVEIQVGLHRRLDPEYRAARQAVLAGEIGDVYLVRMASHDSAPGDPAFIGGSGGIERDLLIHDFDAARFVTGQRITVVESMTGAGGFPVLAAYEGHDDVGVVGGVIRFERGAVGLVSGLRHHPTGHDVRMEVHGSKGSTVVGWDPNSPLQPSGRDPHRAFLDRFAEAYAAEMEAFAAFAAGQQPNPCPPDRARGAFVVALAAERSRREGRPVEVAEMG